MIDSQDPGRVLLLCGPPAAGKDYLAGSWVRSGQIKPAWIVSADGTRNSIADTPADHESEEWIWAHVRGVLRERVRRGLPSILAATNIRAENLEATASVIRECGGRLAVLRLEVPLHELERRNAARRRVVPAWVMGNLHEQFVANCDTDELANRIGGQVFADPSDALAWLTSDAAQDLLPNTRWLPLLGREGALGSVDGQEPALDTGVLLLHGFGSDADEVGGLFSVLSSRLALEGIPSARVRLPYGGAGDVLCAESTMAEATELAIEAARVLQEQASIQRLVVVGFSLGGAVAARLAAEGIADRLILWSTSTTMLTDALDPEGPDEQSVDLGFRTIRATTGFVKDVNQQLQVLPEAVSRTPTLLVAGNRDRPVIDALPSLLRVGTQAEARVVPSDHILGALETKPDAGWLGLDTVDMTVTWIVREADPGRPRQNP